MLLVGQQEGHPVCKKTGWWGTGMVICLEQGADLHTAQLMPLPLTVSCFSKSKLVLRFWYRLTQVKGKGSPYSITERRVPELIPVLASQPAVCCHYFPPGL